MSADDTPTWDGIIADYERAVESGDPPDREELIGQHSDLADDLNAFFTNHDQMKRAVGSEDATLQPGQVAPAGHNEARHCHLQEPLLRMQPYRQLATRTKTQQSHVAAP